MTVPTPNAFVCTRCGDMQPAGTFAPARWSVVTVSFHVGANKRTQLCPSRTRAVELLLNTVPAKDAP